MPFDEYKEHKENLEKIIANGKQNPNDEKAVAKAEKAKIALRKNLMRVILAIALWLKIHALNGCDNSKRSSKRTYSPSRI